MIILINPPGLKSFSGLQMHTPNPPLGLAYIAAAVKEAGHQYHVVDAVGEALDRVRSYPAREDLMIQGLSPSEIVQRMPATTDVVGITCNFSTLWPLARMVAEEVQRSFPGALLVLGGEHGTAVPDYVLGNSRFDVVVLGEGEITFLKLLEARRNGESLSTIKGLAFNSGGVVNTGLSPRRRDINNIPRPDWDSFPIEEYIARHQSNGINLGRSMPLLATRGCPYRCTFCSNESMWTTRYVPRDPKSVVDEMEFYVRKYDVSNFDFQDLTPAVKRRWAVEFCSELIRRDLNITWQMPSGTRAEIFDEKVAGLMACSGCRAFAFAPESGAPKILQSIGKKVDMDKLLEAVRIAVGHGFKLSCFIVIGFPNETPDTLRMTSRLVGKLAFMGVSDIAVTKFVPYPGSELFRQLQAEGKVHLDDDFFVSPMDFYTAKAPSYAEAISSKMLYRTMLWLFFKFYLLSFLHNPVTLARNVLRAVFKGEESTRYAKWFVDRFHTRRNWKKLANKLG